MYFKATSRVNPDTKKLDGYYRLVESYRNSTGRVCHRTILNIGFWEDDLTADQLNVIARTLTAMYQQKASIFPESDPLILKWVKEFWSRIVKEQRLDLTLYNQDSRMIDADTIRHNNVREIGAEWICYNAWQELGIDKVLLDNGFSQSEVHLAQKQIISRAVAS